MDRLQGRKRHLAGRIDWLKRYLLGEMEAAGREKVKGPTLTVSLAKAPLSCDVVCAADVPAEFQRIKVEVDRSRILEHFRQTGEIVPGTTIAVDRRYVRIALVRPGSLGVPGGRARAGGSVKTAKQIHVPWLRLRLDSREGRRQTSNTTPTPRPVPAHPVPRTLFRGAGSLTSPSSSVLRVAITDGGWH